MPSKTVGLMAQMTESPLRDFEALIRSGAPIVVVESNEEPQVVRMARQIAQETSTQTLSLDGDRRFAGLRPDGPAEAPRPKIYRRAEFHQNFRP